MQRRFLTAFVLVSFAAFAAAMLLRRAAEHGGIVPAVLGGVAALVALAGLLALGRIVVVVERATRRVDR